MTDHPTLTDAEREALRDELAGVSMPTERQARAVLWFLDGWLSTEDGPGAEWAREYLGEHAAAIAASMVEQGSAQPDGLAERVRALEPIWEGWQSHPRGPSLTWDPDEDGETLLPSTASAGWNVTGGCRINFEAAAIGTGLPRVFVSVSGRARQDGVAVTDATASDFRDLAAYLLHVADQADRLALLHALLGDAGEREGDGRG